MILERRGWRITVLGFGGVVPAGDWIATSMIDARADGIFGHHAHRLQPLGRHADRPIA